MKIYAFHEKTPRIARSALIADNVIIIGDVEIGENCSIWPGVVIRSDTTPIRIGANVHIEENSILHTSTHIEDNVMIGHGCCIEGFIGHDSMLGNTASMMPMSRLGAHSTLAAGSVLMDGAELPPYSFALGVPAKVHSRIELDNPKHIARRATTYIEGPRGIAALADEYRRQGIWSRD
ncbi:gamma carbonic anhydrase family protein [Phenylobacterium sp. LjRoot225]|uniref:gamma carbonic anhydrase family protein n=1 Tax=Phenylobacterium sp. LjRoot225 TaxID=3342285 RepID=UPI003ED010FD